jgi:hypothetical protein
MDVRTQPRERVFSILNDNDCPSFVIRQRRSSPEPQSKLPDRTLPSPKQRRPSLIRHAQYQRSSSFSSTTSSTPPLLRYDSSSSKSSNGSMDSSPSPITPAYNYNDGSLLLPYDNVLRQDLTGLMASPSGVTPFMEQQLMMAPMPDAFPGKVLPQAITPALPQTLPGLQYPILPNTIPEPPQQLPTPTSLNSAPSSLPAQSATNSTSPPNATVPTKKNKYPCPYSQSHNCSATFTTSGHAARHGKKHTGEKGVHCPVCNKAFTRKDNMKQHERTHKNNSADSKSETSENPRRSKAAITRDNVRQKIKKTDSSGSDPTSQPSLLQSPLSEVTSIAPSLEAPIPMDDPSIYPVDPNVPMMSTIPIPLALPDTLPANALYSGIPDDAVLAAAAGVLPLNSIEKMPVPDVMNVPPLPVAPPLIRGFSDLDTLAQAAETFDPYYQQPI